MKEPFKKLTRALGCALCLIFIVSLPPALAKNTEIGKSSAAKSSAQKSTSKAKKQPFNLYSMDQDIQLGEMVEQEQLKELRRKRIRYDSEEKREMRDRLDRIMSRIISVSDMPTLPYSLHYVEAPIVNAMCAPGGKVFVYEGLSDPKKGLVRAESDAEFAAVLGHEYAHATRRHVTRQLTRYQGYSLLGNIAGALIGANMGANASQVFGRFYSLGGMFYFPQYGRKYETEADLVGARYMAKAGYNPQVAVDLWRRASEKRKAKGKSDKTSIFDSHPASGERAKRLQQELPQILPLYENSLKAPESTAEKKYETHIHYREPGSPTH